jgi:hypothetical protein
VLSLVAKGFAYIESPLKTVVGFIMTVGAKIFDVILDIAATAMEYFGESGSSKALNGARSAQMQMSLEGGKMSRSAGSGSWSAALESAAKSLGDSGAAGIDAAGAMNGVLGDLNTWLKGVSTNLDSGAESKFGGLLNPAKEAIEKLIKTLGGGAILGADAPAADAEKQKGASAVDSIDSVVGSIKVGADIAADLQKKTVTEQKKTNVLLSQISNKSGALT